jgi:hypothetical protein
MTVQWEILHFTYSSLVLAAGQPWRSIRLSSLHLEPLSSFQSVSNTKWSFHFYFKSFSNPAPPGSAVHSMSFLLLAAKCTNSRTTANATKIVKLKLFSNQLFANQFFFVKGAARSYFGPYNTDDFPTEQLHVNLSKPIIFMLFKYLLCQQPLTILFQNMKINIFEFWMFSLTKFRRNFL